jgi:Delta7-sterol 5-desaturase
METLLEILKNLPLAYLQGVAMMGSVMLIVYVLVWRVFRKRLARYRVQRKQRADGAQIRSEIRHGLLSALTGAITSVVIIGLSEIGLTTLYTDYDKHGWLWSVSCLPVLWLIDDAWFYWVHRMLHYKPLYRLIHRVHHDSIDVTPFTSMSFHFAEAFLLFC